MTPLSIKGKQFFSDIKPKPIADLHLVVVTHLLDNEPVFLECLVEFSDLAMILPKPKSIDAQVLGKMEKITQVVIKKREQLASPEIVAALLNDSVPVGDLILVDIGGYFSASLALLKERLNARLLGVVEVTENGHQRYAQLSDLDVPVVSLARSPLKGPEDYLTGQSIVFSAEALMRECHHIINGGNAVVFGYGKIGRSIAKALHHKNINTKIVEIDPVRAIEARSRGFELIDKEAALQGSDVIFCATGNQSLNHHDFGRVRNGAFIFSVTSSDDELDLSRVDANFDVAQVTNHISRYERLGQYFHLANSGNAINFIHNAEVGPYIYLVQGEIIAAIDFLCQQSHKAELTEISVAARRRLAQQWLMHFGE